MKSILLFITVLLVAGCSSSYNPSEKMLTYKKTMTTEQAIKILQKIIWDEGDTKGICGARGFWYDESSNMLVHEENVSMLAHKRGKELKNVHQTHDDIVVFEKQYYNYKFEFKEIALIGIYKDPLLLTTFPACNNPDLKDDYRVIDLFSSKLNNLKFIVPNAEFDKTMAALAILMPDKRVKNK